ncbi:hypothetical protein [Prosthecobacter dejongeii]|uniref:Uncharacterized protein n=1 Tax=Prosthecobacter dejongeii TaxID=48465 RepID=A0A7W7YNH0_9BACT|nr:hypothetical protein [Prosthecobacter dejongeii]MBB5039237.1 hypothetical protein [Prosthecobacter dejongeii]
MRISPPTMVFRHVKIIALLLAGTATSIWAQASFPSPVLTSITPLGGKPGSHVEIQFRGSDLDGAKTLLLSSLSRTDSRSLQLEPVAGKKGMLGVQLPNNLPNDFYDVRLVGRYGVSNPRVFQVSHLDNVESPGSNSKSDRALKVPLNAAIQGVFKESIPHWFAFDAQKGQRILGVFVGANFGSRVSLVGAVIDHSGREWARLRDGLLDFTAPSDGEFKLRINDLMFGAGDEYGYRLNLTTGAVVWGIAGDVAYGWNLPGGKAEHGLRISQANSLERLVVDSVKKADLLSTSPVIPFILGKEADTVAPPAASPILLQLDQQTGGWFPENGASQSFELAFKAGERFTLEVISQQMGLPTDPLLLIESVKKDSAGKESLTLQADVNDPVVNIPGPSVRLSRLDPFYSYEAKADGVFRLSLSDPLNAANGRRYPYRLRVSKIIESRVENAIAIHPTLPPVAATGPYEIPSANVWRQGVTAIEVFLPGRSASSEFVNLTVTDLPQGVTCLGGFVGKGQSLGYIGFQASKDAPLGASVLAGLRQTAFLNWALKDTGREVMSTRLAGPPALGVVAEQAPAIIECITPGILEASPEGKLELAFKATRHNACIDALKLKVLGLVDVTKAPELTIPAKALEGKLRMDVKALKLAPGEYGFILQGPARMPYRREGAAIAEAEALVKIASQSRTDIQKELEAVNVTLKALKPEDQAGRAQFQIQMKELTAKMAKADQAKAVAIKTLKDLTAKNPAKDTTFIVYSNPIRIRVKEAAKK